MVDRVIGYINDVHKEKLTPKQENEIESVVDFANNQQKAKIPTNALIV